MTNNEQTGKMANANLVVLAVLFIVGALFGILGAFIVTIGYGVYFRYWRPTLILIPVSLVSIIVTIVAALASGDPTSAQIIGAIIGLIPSGVSYYLFRKRIMELKG